MYLFSKTAASNGTADPAVNAREGQAPSSINDAIRGLMSRVADWLADITGSLTTGGTGSAYTLTTNQNYNPAGTATTPPDGVTVTFCPHATNASPATLSVDSITANPLRVATGADIPAGILALGTPYQATYFASANEWLVHGVANTQPTVDLVAIIGDGQNVIATGVTGRFLGPIDFSCTILGWSILGQESGSISIELQKCTYSQFDAGSTHPVTGDKISASAPITYSSAKKAQSSSLSGWTTAISAGDILGFAVNSVTSAKQVIVTLKVLKTS